MSGKREEEVEPIEEDNDNEDNDDDEEEPPPQMFINSSAFAFMTDDAYKRLEEEGTEITSGKLFKHVRPMKARVAVLENPHGSVRLWQGGTSVLAAVYGPSDVKMSKELPHRAAVDVLFRPKVTGNANVNAMVAAGVMDPVQEERALEQTLTSILESVIYLEDHVQAGFNVIVHEIQDEGCLLSTCINACSLALLNAGCSLRSLFAAVTLYISDNDKVLVDPSKSQIEALLKSSSSPPSILTITCTNDRLSQPQVLHVHGKGRMTPKILRTCYEYACSDAIMPEIFGFFAGVVASDLGALTSSKQQHDVEMKEIIDVE